jgi:hypothetical protein
MCGAGLGGNMPGDGGFGTPKADIKSRPSRASRLRRRFVPRRGDVLLDVSRANKPLIVLKVNIVRPLIKKVFSSSALDFLQLQRASRLTRRSFISLQMREKNRCVRLQHEKLFLLATVK